LTFDLYPLRFRIASNRPGPLTPNLWRGALGSALKKLSEDDYRRLFTPARPPGDGPSGFADPPRPFVFRIFDSNQIGMNVFATREPALDLFIHAMRNIDAFTIESIAGTELLRLPLAGCRAAVPRLRIRFLTPTELKGAARPDFGVLMSRIRDRISTLRELYGAGPLDLDFKAFGDRASRVSMTRCDVTRVTASRTSRATGQKHPLGGFTGICEYEGDLTEFVPYLEIARSTGVGRHTVWGNGEISYESF
jgi:hypothetical protein